MQVAVYDPLQIDVNGHVCPQVAQRLNQLRAAGRAFMVGAAPVGQFGYLHGRSLRSQSTQAVGRDHRYRLIPKCTAQHFSASLLAAFLQVGVGTQEVCQSG